MRLKHKVAVITGGARGIGRETALAFAREGARLIICDVDERSGEKTMGEIISSGAEGMFCKVDVTKREQIESMVRKTVENFGRIDILVNNAGITRDAMLHKMSEEQWDEILGVNLKGVFNCTQAVVGIMAAQGKGKIINASSVVALYGNIGQTNYVASKAGVIGMTKSWAKELGRKGINVNAIAPGFILTEMTAKVPEKILEIMKEKTPLRRLGKPEDIANAYLFLASEEANFINGVVLSVDGGLVL